ncbi:hypothetical protein BOX15_Mlig016668g1, partial [Macrostomum lignano]
FKQAQTMEKQLKSQLDTVMNTEGVVAVLAVDSRGLPLASKGAVSGDISGAVKSLADHATALAREASSSSSGPRVTAVSVNTDSMCMLVSQAPDVGSGVTTAVFKFNT